MSPAVARQLNALAALIICGVLLGAYWVQFGRHEFPCPLCLLQRLGLLGVIFGALMNVRFGPRPRYYAFSLLSALFGASVAIRQILLHIVPGTGAYGSTIFGWHLYTWSFVVAAIAILLTVLMLLSNKQFESPQEQDSGSFGKLAKLVFVVALLIAAANVVTTFLECGLGQCPDNPTIYKELS